MLHTIYWMSINEFVDVESSATNSVISSFMTSKSIKNIRTRLLKLKKIDGFRGNAAASVFIQIPLIYIM